MNNINRYKVLGYVLATLLCGGWSSAASIYQLPVVNGYGYHLPSPISSNIGLPVRLPVVDAPLIVVGQPISLPSPIKDPVIGDYRPSSVIYSPIGMRGMPTSPVLPVIRATPIFRAAGRILHGADKKNADQRALDKLFENVKSPEEAPAVDATPAKKNSKPTPPITWPELDLANEIGLP